MAELNSTIRKLEDRNSLLVDERNELVQTSDLVKKNNPLPLLSLAVLLSRVSYNLISPCVPFSAPAEARSRVRAAV